VFYAQSTGAANKKEEKKKKRKKVTKIKTICTSSMTYMHN